MTPAHRKERALTGVGAAEGRGGGKGGGAGGGGASRVGSASPRPDSGVGSGMGTLSPHSPQKASPGVRGEPHFSQALFCIVTISRLRGSRRRCKTFSRRESGGGIAGSGRTRAKAAALPEA